VRLLPQPTTDDLVALTRLEKSWGKSAKAIRPVHPSIRTQFIAYAAAGGDPWQVVADPALAGFSAALEELYEYPPVALGHVKTIRDGLTGACPMCGRDALGTLDHYLPKANYPEFCFFSRNLVPACSRCNTARSTAVIGLNPGQRALQPYFDAFASQRVLSVELTGNLQAPDIRPLPFNVVGAAALVVNWQIDNVLIPAGFAAYAAPIWGTLVDNPLSILDEVPTAEAVAEGLERLERADAALSQSQNSWRSSIFHGVRNNQNAIAFLAQRVDTAMKRPPR
jgi:hypothetical protein